MPTEFDPEHDDWWWIDEAERQYTEADGIRVDQDHPAVQLEYDNEGLGGAWVRAWVWIPTPI